MVSGWFKGITFIVCFISIIIISAPPWITGYLIWEAGDLCLTLSYFQDPLSFTFLSSLWKVCWSFKGCVKSHLLYGVFLIRIKFSLWSVWYYISYHDWTYMLPGDMSFSPDTTFWHWRLFYLYVNFWTKNIFVCFSPYTA